MSNIDVHFSSKTDMWATPIDFFEELNDEFHFTTDVCATADNAKCKNFFSPEINGLDQDWVGVCFMNPPYGREIGNWVVKAYDENRKNGATIVALLPARTDTRWFHDFIYGKTEVRFIKGRLKFGGSKNSAPFPSMVVIWRGK